MVDCYHSPTMPLARSLPLTLALALAACVTPKGMATTVEPKLELQPGAGVRPTNVALPMHASAVVDLAFVEAGEGARWQLMSADAQGWIRIWRDGRLRAASQGHRGGVTALVVGVDGVPFSAGMDGRVIEWSRDGERIERVLLARAPASPPDPAKTKDAKVDPASSQDPAAGTRKIEPDKLAQPRPIIALALARDAIAISDGHWVQVWSREATPRMLWSHHSRAFVSGLALARDGSAIAMAMLREEALRQGIAEHPAAEFPQPRGTRDPARARELADQEALTRMQARVDHPGATADLIEVHGLGADWDVTLEPLAPIDADLSMPEEGLLIYREVYGPDLTRVIGRSIGNKVHIGVRVGVIATTPGPNDLPTPTEPSEGLADFAFGRGLDAEQPPIGMRLEPYDSLPIAGRRELAIGSKYWAAGDEHGQLVIGPREGGALEWLPASEPIELIAAAPNQPQLVTSGLEQPVRIRRWQLVEGTQRMVGMILPPAPDPETGEIPPSLYPVELAIDDSGNRIAVSSWSFSAEQASELRLFDLASGAAKVVQQGATPEGLDIALAAEGDSLWSWFAGSRARAFAAPEWQASETQGLGRPVASADARWLAFVTQDRRQIFDRVEQRMDQDQKLASTMPTEFVAALARDGTLALVVPLGGGTIERLHPSEGVLPSITTFGPVTALAWIPDPAGGESLLIGQGEGSIDRLEPGASEPSPLRPAEGGRVWSLAGVGGSLGGFVELDEEGLWMHRLGDGATLSVALASPEPLVAEAMANPNASPNPNGASQGLVVVWRPSAGAPACRVYDGTSAGVVTREGVALELGAPTILADFFAGVVACAPEPEPSEVEAPSDSTEPADAASEPTEVPSEPAQPASAE